jgi:WD40 repeat protein
MRILAGHRGAIRAVAFAPGDPTTLASGGDDGTVRLWNPLRQVTWATLPRAGRRAAVLALAFAPDGGLLAVGRKDGSLEMWEVAMQTLHAQRPCFHGPVCALAFAPDGKSVLAAPLSQDRTAGDYDSLLFWEYPWDAPPQYFGWPGGILSMAFTPDGAVGAFGDDRRTVEVWQRQPWERRAMLHLPNRVRSVAFAPGDGCTLAAATGRVVELWDVEDQRRIVVCKGHRGDVRALGFLPGGAALLSGSADRTVRVWDPATGRELAAWNWEVGPVLALSVAPDGMTAAVGGAKRDLVVWDLGAT